MVNDSTIATSNGRYAITIPAGGTGAQLAQLLTDAGCIRVPEILTVLILPRTPDGADRGAFLAASPRPGVAINAADFTTHGEHVAAAEPYTSPSRGDTGSYLRAAGGSPVAAVAVVFW